MSKEDKTRAPAAGGGLLGRLFGRGGHGSSQADADSAARGSNMLDLADIQGFILRGYRMPMVRHFLLTVGDAAKARKLLGDLSVAMNLPRRRSPQPRTGTSGLRLGQETTPPVRRGANPTIA